MTTNVKIGRGNLFQLFDTNASPEAWVTVAEVNRMRARLMSGYWVFQAPVGYRYESRAGSGKVLVRDEPNASTIKEVLEGFAAGRFETLTEVQRHLRGVPE
jgi:site-specific DNA recombinase